MFFFNKIALAKPVDQGNAFVDNDSKAVPFVVLKATRNDKLLQEVFQTQQIDNVEMLYSKAVDALFLILFMGKKKITINFDFRESTNILAGIFTRKIIVLQHNSLGDSYKLVLNLSSQLKIRQDLWDDMISDYLRRKLEQDNISLDKLEDLKIQMMDSLESPWR